jgi:hypothetical protein
VVLVRELASYRSNVCIPTGLGQTCQGDGVFKLGKRNPDVFDGVGPIFINGSANSEKVPYVVLEKRYDVMDVRESDDC